MITGGDMYTVLSAMVPLYVAMMLGYASVRWWGIFSAVQCSGINRFVAVFAVPLLSFTFIAANNPYKMDGAFILADTASKLAVLAALVTWTQVRRLWRINECFSSSSFSFWLSRRRRRKRRSSGGGDNDYLDEEEAERGGAAAATGGAATTGGLDWFITLFSLATLPNTLVMGIPLLRAMYGDAYGELMVQVVVLQSIIWYTLLLFLFELRAALVLLTERLAAAGGGGGAAAAAAAIVGVDVDPDVVSLDGREPLHTEAHVGDDGKIRVFIRRSVSVSSNRHHHHLHHPYHDLIAAAAAASPPRRSAAANFYSPHRPSAAAAPPIADFYVPSSPGRRSTSVMNLDLYGAATPCRLSTSMDMMMAGSGGGGGYGSSPPRRSSATAAAGDISAPDQIYYNNYYSNNNMNNPFGGAAASRSSDLTLGFTSTFTEPAYLRSNAPPLSFHHQLGGGGSPRTSNVTNYDFPPSIINNSAAAAAAALPANYSRQSSHCPTPRTSMTSIPPPPLPGGTTYNNNNNNNMSGLHPAAAAALAMGDQHNHHHLQSFAARRDRDLPLEVAESAAPPSGNYYATKLDLVKGSQSIESTMGGNMRKIKTTPTINNVGEPQSTENVIGNDENVDRISASISTTLQNNTPSKLQRCSSTNTNEKNSTYIDDALTTKPVLPSTMIMAKLILKMVSRKLIRNPNTYASLIGVIWSLVAFRYGIGMPKIISKSLQILSQAGLGMAMFSLGLFMALQPKIIACGTYLAVLAMVVRFFIGPILMSVASIIVGLRGVHLHAAIVQAALPQGIVPFVFSREYDLHPEILSTAVIFGMLVALPTTLLYYVLLGI